MVTDVGLLEFFRDGEEIFVCDKHSDSWDINDFSNKDEEIAKLISIVEPHLTAIEEIFINELRETEWQPSGQSDLEAFIENLGDYILELDGTGLEVNGVSFFAR